MHATLQYQRLRQHARAPETLQQAVFFKRDPLTPTDESPGMKFVDSVRKTPAHSLYLFNMNRFHT